MRLRRLRAARGAAKSPVAAEACGLLTEWHEQAGAGTPRPQRRAPVPCRVVRQPWTRGRVPIGQADEPRWLRRQREAPLIPPAVVIRRACGRANGPIGRGRGNSQTRLCWPAAAAALAGGRRLLTRHQDQQRACRDALPGASQCIPAHRLTPLPGAAVARTSIALVARRTSPLASLTS